MQKGFKNAGQGFVEMVYILWSRASKPHSLLIHVGTRGPPIGLSFRHDWRLWGWFRVWAEITLTGQSLSTKLGLLEMNIISVHASYPLCFFLRWFVSSQGSLFTKINKLVWRCWGSGWCQVYHLVIMRSDCDELFCWKLAVRKSGLIFDVSQALSAYSPAVNKSLIEYIMPSELMDWFWYNDGSILCWLKHSSQFHLQHQGKYGKIYATTLSTQ